MQVIAMFKQCAGLSRLEALFAFAVGLQETFALALGIFGGADVAPKEHHPLMQAV